MLEAPPYLSASSIGTWKQCRLKYKFAKIDKLPDPSGWEAVLGNFVHDVLEDLLHMPAKDRHLEATRGLARAQWDDKWGAALAVLDVDLADMKHRAWVCLEGYFRLEDPTKVVPAGLEHQINASIDGVPIKGFIDRWEDRSGSIHVVDYKGLALDTPLPTPTGWTTMGAVQIGDDLVGIDGLPTKVVGKGDVRHRQCYRIVFDDASEIVCDDEHLWLVNMNPERRDAGPDRVTKVITTDEMAHYRGDRYVIRVPVAAPLQGEPVDLAMDPYVLGVWLGDGHNNRSSIHSSDEDAKHFRQFFDRAGFTTTDWAEANAFGALGLTPALRSLGVLGSKRIPPQYLRAEISDRQAILRGLMDTDGHWHDGRKEAIFVTVLPGLASDVEDLIASLGCKVYTFTKPYITEKGKEGLAHYIKFRPTWFNPFTLPRKAEGFVSGGTWRTRRSVKSVEVVDSVPTQCVTVDAPDSLYLCGRAMVPTHNSGAYPKKREWQDEKYVQLLIYAYALEAEQGIPAGSVELLFVRDRRRLHKRVTDDDMALVESVVRSTYDQIQQACEAEVFEPSPSRLCDWCNYKNICPAWAE